MMSTTKKTTRKRAPKTPELSPEQQKLQELMKELINESTTLIVKVAVCDCEKINECPVYKGAKRIAKIVDKILSLRK